MFGESCAWKAHAREGAALVLGGAGGFSALL